MNVSAMQIFPHDPNFLKGFDLFVHGCHDHVILTIGTANCSAFRMEIKRNPDAQEIIHVHLPVDLDQNKRVIFIHESSPSKPGFRMVCTYFNYGPGHAPRALPDRNGFPGHRIIYFPDKFW